MIPINMLKNSRLIFIVMFMCTKYMCIIMLKPLYMLLVRDMKQRWNSHSIILFNSLLQLNK